MESNTVGTNTPVDEDQTTPVEALSPAERRARIARINGAKSRGPVTPEGKARSSKNAITHGVLACSVVLESESQSAFKAILQELIDCVRPLAGAEMNLVQDMATTRWRQMRAMTVEKYDYDARLAQQPASLGSPPAQAA